MDNSKVDQISDSMNGTHRGQSYQYDTDLILGLQRNNPSGFAAELNQINDRVNMKSLGFPEDFKIVSVSNDNRITTLSQDGTKYQIRDGSSLDIQQEIPYGGISPLLPGGSHDFVAKPDGSAEYTVKAGDTLWNITKDVLSRNGSGQPPSSTDIDQTYRKIAEANALKNPNRLSVGEKLNIPAPGTDGIYPAPSPATPGYFGNNGALTSYSSNLKPDAKGVFNPMAAAGLPGSDDDYVYSRTETNQENIGNNQRSVYTGWLRDSSLGMNGDNTKFDASEVTDPTGKILSRHIDYSNPIEQYKDTGAQIQFDRGFGSPITLGVRSTDTTIDVTGNYQTTIRTDDGRVYNSITDSHGKVLKFYQA